MCHPALQWPPKSVSDQHLSMICLACLDCERHPLSGCGVACNLEGLLSSCCILWKLLWPTVQIRLAHELPLCDCLFFISRL